MPTVVGSAMGSDGGTESGLDGGTDSSLADAGETSGDAATVIDAAREPDRDVEPLNELLVNAYNAATAYGVCGGLIQGAPPTDEFAGQAAVLRELTVSFQAHHKAHARQLSAAVIERGGTPVTEQEVSSRFKAPDALRNHPSITNVLKYAAGLERSGALAGNRSIGQLEAAYYRYLASVIEGVQAQHFSLLLGLLMGVVEAGSQFNAGTAARAVPVAFVHSVDLQPGLDTTPPHYFG
jgi:hypothetical protein